jgi:glycosyltransferase involved in cell wall biosynthesis
MAAVSRSVDPVPAELRSAGGVWAVGMVRDEADIIETVVGHLVAQGIERVVVADNGSHDETPVLLDALARSYPVTVLADSLTAYYQAEKMTTLGRAAARAGATWVIPFDADEVWSAPGGSIASWLEGCDADVVQVPVFNHLPTDRDDPAEPDPVRRIRWRKKDPNRLHKVAFRTHRRARLAQGNHGVSRRGRRTTGLEIRHFPYRSEAQFVRKVRQGGAALAATDVMPDLGKHWRRLAEASDDDELRGAWRSLLATHNLEFEWWVPRSDLVEDPAHVSRLPLER